MSVPDHGQGRCASALVCAPLCQGASFPGLLPWLASAWCPAAAAPSECLGTPTARRYEREGRPRKTIKAQQLWFAILEAQVGAWGGQRLEGVGV